MMQRTMSTVAAGLTGVLVALLGTAVLAPGDLTYHVSAWTGSIAANSNETAIAECPAGTRVISGGFEIVNQGGSVEVVVSSYGSGSQPTLWRGMFWNHGGSADTGGAWVHAVCEEI